MFPLKKLACKGLGFNVSSSLSCLPSIVKLTSTQKDRSFDLIIIHRGVNWCKDWHDGDIHDLYVSWLDCDKPEKIAQQLGLDMIVVFLYCAHNRYIPHSGNRCVFVSSKFDLFSIFAVAIPCVISCYVQSSCNSTLHVVIYCL